MDVDDYISYDGSKITNNPALIRYKEHLKRTNWLNKNMPKLSIGDSIVISSNIFSNAGDDSAALHFFSGEVLTVRECIDVKRFTFIDCDYFYKTFEDQQEYDFSWSPEYINIPETLKLNGITLIPNGEIYSFKKQTIRNLPNLPII